VASSHGEHGARKIVMEWCEEMFSDIGSGL